MVATAKPLSPEIFIVLTTAMLPGSRPVTEPKSEIKPSFDDLSVTLYGPTELRSQLKTNDVGVYVYPPAGVTMNSM